jgi:hypothetical protein
MVAAYERALRERERLSRRGIRDVIALMSGLRTDIIERMESFADRENLTFSQRQATQMIGEIDRTLAEFSGRASDTAVSAMREAFGAGSLVTATALRAAGLPINFPVIDTEILTVLSQATSVTMDEVVSDLGTKVAREIRRSIAGLDSASETIRRVASLLRGSTEFARGLRRRIGLAFQAEQIVGTEIARIFSAAQHAGRLQIAEQIPELRKRWRTVGGDRVRRGHREVEARYAPEGEIGPIPVDERYFVETFSRWSGTRTEYITVRSGAGGQRVIRLRDKKGNPRSVQRSGPIIQDRLLYARDPAGSPGAVIRCRCWEMETLPDLDLALQRVSGEVDIDSILGDL